MNGDAKAGLNPWTILGWIFDALGASALAFCVWMATEIADLKEWRAETSGNRWSSLNQVDYAQKQTAEITRIWQEMAIMKTDWLKSIGEVNLKLAQLPQSLQVPPKWWEEYVRENIRSHDDRLKALEKRKESQ